METPGWNKTALGHHGVDQSVLELLGSGNKATGTLEVGVAGGTRNLIWT